MRVRAESRRFCRELLEAGAASARFFRKETEELKFSGGRRPGGEPVR